MVTGSAAEGTSDFFSDLEIVPADLDARVQSLFGSDRRAAGHETERLVRGVADLVDQHVPAVSTAGAH
jgi:hypothetical protein